jgi:hypothetical protein
MKAPGMWLKFRHGRAQVIGGTATENKTLLTLKTLKTLKFSEDTSLDKQVK